MIFVLALLVLPTFGLVGIFTPPIQWFANPDNPYCGDSYDIASKDRGFRGSIYCQSISFDYKAEAIKYWCVLALVKREDHIDFSFLAAQLGQ